MGLHQVARHFILSFQDKVGSRVTWLVALGACWLLLIEVDGGLSWAELAGL
jgi:hypothetical protein